MGVFNCFPNGKRPPFEWGADILVKNFYQSHLGHTGKSQVGHIGKKEKSISVTLVKDVQVGLIGN